MAPKKGLIEKEIPNLETITIWSVYISFRVFFSQKDGQKGNLKDLSGMLLDRAQNHSTSIIYGCVLSFQIGGSPITLLEFSP